MTLFNDSGSAANDLMTAAQLHGASAPKWIGKCPSCGEWNTYVEEVVSTTPSQVPAWRSSSTRSETAGRQATPQLLGEIAPDKLIRMPLPGKELNRVLGGGLVPGSLVLVGGEPGIGKSTLMLQVAMRLKRCENTLYQR
jgi:DNA repair protein RadA/Sms